MRRSPGSTGIPIAGPHPLDPLSPTELESAARLVQEHLHAGPGELAFSAIALCDPSREELSCSRAAPRRATVSVRRAASRQTFAARVRLDGSGAVERWEEVTDGMPIISGECVEMAAAAALADERFAAALRRRGIDDFGTVQVDTLSPGSYPQNPPGRRIVWATPYLRPSPDSNPYAHPIENVRAAVDIDLIEVLDVLDGPVVPIAPLDGDYASEDAVGGWRDAPARLEITQPDGVGFRVDGHIVQWQKWRLHVALHPVDGLILGDIRYQDADEWRQIIHRASLSEMVVPYGDPHDGFYWRAYFDAGEYGIGRCTNSLVLGCDCVGEIRYVDGYVNDDDGSARRIPNAICLHEEDHSILAKHTDPGTGSAYVRRARRLVVSNFATVGNYDYGFYWYFYQDGSIEFEVKLTGIVLTRGVRDDEEHRSSALIAPNLAAPHHQHLFNVRLDMAVDGFANSVVENEVAADEPGPENPWGQSIIQRTVPIRSEAQARRFVDPLRARTWTVRNNGRRNRLGEPVGYRLVPHAGPLLLASPDSSVGRRAGFAQAHLWVTRYDPDELHAAGDFPGQHGGGDGIVRCLERDADLQDADLVLWHTLGVSHAVRTEDWPMMPVERIGFMLRPAGFFDRAPSLDVPPSEPADRCATTADHCH